MPEYTHKPVLVSEVLFYLGPKSGGFYVDGTVGEGGHAEAILDASGPEGRLFGCDCDPKLLEKVRARLARFGDRVKLEKGNFAELSKWVAPESCDGILFDLGVCSAQLEEPARGLSVHLDGPLDMRLDPDIAVTAADIINTYSENDLTDLFWKLGGERYARKVARAIVYERSHVRGGIRTTGQLARIVERVIPSRNSQRHPATKVFLALRIAVNDELGALERGLEGAVKLLKPGGRLLVISFHSGEARIIKEFGRRNTSPWKVRGKVDVPELREPGKPCLKWVVKDPITPSKEEVEQNPRSRSAQLRVFEKIS